MTAIIRPASLCGSSILRWTQASEMGDCRVHRGKRHLARIAVIAVCAIFLVRGAVAADVDGLLRIPAEWETHAATWMQWPGSWEAGMRPAFARIIATVQQYEPVHILTGSASEQSEAKRFLIDRGVSFESITWHVAPIDNAWMRDNGPVYVVDGGDLRILDWGFDAWGGNFGPEVGHRADDRIPTFVGSVLGLSVADLGSYVLERGNLESNGAGTLLLNWDCQQHRNPGLSQAQHEEVLRSALGARTILWAYGYDRVDLTTGHIDGIARFVAEDQVLVAEYPSQVEFDRFVADCAAAGLTVIRYPGDPNWLVGNGFVAAMSAGGAEDEPLRALLESAFPGRDVHMIDARSIAASGGGIHCVTSDQPAAP